MIMTANFCTLSVYHRGSCLLDQKPIRTISVDVEDESIPIWNGNRQYFLPGRRSTIIDVSFYISPEEETLFVPENVARLDEIVVERNGHIVRYLGYLTSLNSSYILDTPMLFVQVIWRESPQFNNLVPVMEEGDWRDWDKNHFEPTPKLDWRQVGF